jgi:hypothetical protein
MEGSVEQAPLNQRPLAGALPFIAMRISNLESAVLL